MNKYLRFCPKCHGQKYIQNPIWEEWNNKVEEAEEYFKEKYGTFFNWNKFVRHIEKTILAPEEPEELLCDKCEGKGVFPTIEGLEILELVKKFL